MAFYPEGIQAQSPWLRGTSYPGWAVLVVPTPTGLWRARRFVGHNPVGVEPISPPGFLVSSSGCRGSARRWWGFSVERKMGEGTGMKERGPRNARNTRKSAIFPRILRISRF